VRARRLALHCAGMAQISRLLSVLVGVALLLAGGAPARPADANPRAVATFESIGLYYDRPAAKDGCRVHYRRVGAGEWREGYPLVYDERERQYRGSLVGLQADGAYEIRLEAGGERADLEARTRSEVFPIGKTTYLPGGTTDKSITIKEGGTETG